MPHQTVSNMRRQSAMGTSQTYPKMEMPALSTQVSK
jgi:hypothetical protein